MISYKSLTTMFPECLNVQIRYDKKIHEMQNAIALLNARKHSEEAAVDKISYARLLLELRL